MCSACVSALTYARALAGAVVVVEVHCAAWHGEDYRNHVRFLRSASARPRSVRSSIAFSSHHGATVKVLSHLRNQATFGLDAPKTHARNKSACGPSVPPKHVPKHAPPALTNPAPDLVKQALASNKRTDFMQWRWIAEHCSRCAPIACFQSRPRASRSYTMHQHWV
jgi:hypothetical protein